MAFSHDVSNANHFKYCTHRAASNDAGTFWRWHQDDTSRAMMTKNCVVNSAVFQRRFVHIATSFFHAFLHSSWHFFRFAFTHTNATITITHYCECCKTQNTTTFNNLGYTVDSNHLLAQTIVALVVLHSSLYFCHIDSLELQAGFTRSVSKRFDAAVIGKA